MECSKHRESDCLAVCNERVEHRKFERTPIRAYEISESESYMIARVETSTLFPIALCGKCYRQLRNRPSYDPRNFPNLVGLPTHHLLSTFHAPRLISSSL